MTKLPLLAILAISLGACAKESPAIYKCEATAAQPAAKPGEAWGPKQRLIVLRASGKVELGSFQGRDWRAIGEHHFEPGTLRGQVSPDERWLVVSGRDRKGQIWLYDTRTGRERLLLERARSGETLPHIAPDGHAIAVFVNPYPESPELETSGLYLFDTETGQERRFGFPATGRDMSRAVTTIRWAADSRSLYVFVSHDFDDQPIYQLLPEKGQFEPIEADYNHEAWNSELRIAGKRVPIEPHMLLPSRYDQDPIASSDGAWLALIDEATHELRVNKTGSAPQVIAVGTPTDCGDGLAIRGWVDHYLIFDQGNVPHLFDAEKGRSRALLDAGDEYFWPGAPGYGRP